ncbi:MAG: hypothetical protein ABMA64_24460 [Myxococcota bacterium]
MIELLRGWLVGDWSWQRDVLREAWTVTHDRGLWVRFPAYFDFHGSPEELRELAKSIREAVLDAVEAGLKGEVDIEINARTVWSAKARPAGRRPGIG